MGVANEKKKNVVHWFMNERIQIGVRLNYPVVVSTYKDIWRNRKAFNGVF